MTGGQKLYDSVSKQRSLVILFNVGWRQTTDLRIEDGSKTVGLLIVAYENLLATQQGHCSMESLS